MFPSPLDLVQYLKSIGLGQFAFSYDERIVNSDLSNNLIESIKLCEIKRVGYQVIFTGVNPEKISGIVDNLRRAVGYYLYYLVPVWNEMVDIGGCTQGNKSYDWQSNDAPCGDKGFYHPAYLHVSPDGKIRTCMYAIGSANVGNITEKRFSDLINEFPNNEINRCFSNPVKKQTIFDRFVKPYLPKYRPIIHECTRNAVLVRTVEMRSLDIEPNKSDIYTQIGTELGLIQDRSPKTGKWLRDTFTSNE